MCIQFEYELTPVYTIFVDYLENVLIQIANTKCHQTMP